VLAVRSASVTIKLADVGVREVKKPVLLVETEGEIPLAVAAVRTFE